MALKEQLMADFKEAMKARDEIAKNTINLARAAVKQYEVDNREELDDAGIIAILSKQVKMRKDALADFDLVVDAVFFQVSKDGREAAGGVTAHLDTVAKAGFEVL